MKISPLSHCVRLYYEENDPEYLDPNSLDISSFNEK